MNPYNPKTIYVLQDPEDCFTRILCEEDNSSVILGYDNFISISRMNASEYTLNYLLKIGYEILQEWN